jgi:hypothetical protein
MTFVHTMVTKLMSFSDNKVILALTMVHIKLSLCAQKDFIIHTANPQLTKADQ